MPSSHSHHQLQPSPSAFSELSTSQYDRTFTYPTSPSNSIVLLGALMFAALYLFPKATFFLRGRKKLVDKHGNSIPNGPIGLPIFGSFPFLTSYPELTLDAWSKKYGPLFSMSLGSQLFVVISDPGIAKDLLVTNGAVFSSRKEMFIKSQTIFKGRGITATPYNDRWRKHRRIATGSLNYRAVEQYTDVLDSEATELIKSLYIEGQKSRTGSSSDSGCNPVNPQPHAGRCSLNNMLTIVFGMRTDSISHPLVSQALSISRAFMNCTGPTSNLIDFIPLLQHLPLSLSSPLHTRAESLHQSLVQTYGGMIKDIEHRLERGEDVPDCLAKTLLEIREEEELDELDMTILTSAFMIGGVETTAAIMQWFSALIPAYPDIQKKAHEELDRVIGRGRLPTIDDEKNLPYCRAIIKEVERTHNPFWLGTPHMSTEDFTYAGQFIPEGTVVLLNTYSMHYDGGRHERPFEFNPDRYINDKHSSAESANLANPYERDHWMFGAGRRICPGMLVAEREIWLTISRMLWAFDMTEIPEEPIDLKEYDGLSGRSPVAFRVKMTPRDENVAAVLEL